MNSGPDERCFTRQEFLAGGVGLGIAAGFAG
jgi:hypothetical protein